VEEAARIDGANEWQTATRVMLPIARPGFLTAGRIVALGPSNALLFAVTFMSDPERFPNAIAHTLGFSQGFSRQFDLLNAAGHRRCEGC